MIIQCVKEIIFNKPWVGNMDHLSISSFCFVLVIFLLLGGGGGGGCVDGGVGLFFS